jgi:hypothetical protein
MSTRTDDTLLQVFVDAPQAVLRICPEASAPAWWDAVSRRPDAPPAIDALLSGRRRVEVTAQEATQAIVWAENIDGWAAADPKPVFVHRPGGAPAPPGTGESFRSPAWS